MVQIDRIDGLSSSTAIKGPARAATTANITLSDLQTIDGVELADGDRVLVRSQTDARLNGIYRVSTGLWQRTKDFSSNRDVRKGTRIVVTDGITYATSEWIVTAANPVVFGTSEVTFSQIFFSTGSDVTITGVGVIVKETLSALNAVTPTDENFGGRVLDDPDPTNNGDYYRQASAWVKGADLQRYNLSRLTITGGTVNAIEATTDDGVNPYSAVGFFIDIPDGDENTGAVTIAINGDAPISALDWDDSEFDAGYFRGRMLLSNETTSLKNLDPAAINAREAEASATAAATSETNAAASETAAAASESAAATSETNAAASEAAAATSETNAAASESAAATSETNAAASASAAATSATNAATSETNAGTSETNAASSAASAASSATDAEDAAVTAVAAAASVEYPVSYGVAQGLTPAEQAQARANIGITKGSDIASAATLTLPGDGNYHVVTGTTGVTAISTAAAGTEITLRFAGALTLTHNATSLILPGGQNFVTKAGDVLTFISEGSGNWRCTQAPARLTKWSARLIGEIIYVDTSLTGVEIPPDDAGFIELSAGLDGVGEYNEGKLISETITGSGATLVATAVIDDADSPMDGQTINLVNTEERVLYAGERSKSGDVFSDQAQQMTGAIRNAWFSTGGSFAATGVFSATADQANERAAAGTSGPTKSINFDNANSTGARTGDRTRAKGQFLVAFLKYKDVV